MAPSLSSNAKTFSIYAKKLPKSFGGSDFHPLSLKKLGLGNKKEFFERVT